MLVLSHAQGHVMLETLGVAMGTQFGKESGEWVLELKARSNALFPINYKYLL